MLCYGKGDHIPFREDDDVVFGPTCRSRWAYAASKWVYEFLALAYYREKGLPVVIFRLFNTVWPRQTGRYGMVILRFVQQALKGDPLTVYGDRQQSRCFLHVKDAVNAIMTFAECREAIGDVFNIGSTEEVTIGDLAHKVLAVIKDERRRVEDGDQITYVPHEEAHAVGFEDMRKRVPDISKISDSQDGLQNDHKLRS